MSSSQIQDVTPFHLGGSPDAIGSSKQIIFPVVTDHPQGSTGEMGIPGGGWAIFSLLLVVCLLLLVTKAIQHFSSLRAKAVRSFKDQKLEIISVLPIDPKRKIVSVEVSGSEGKLGTSLILLGGPTDICIGFIYADRPSEAAKTDSNDSNGHNGLHLH
ncbi:hypothetical protein CSR02_14645 [Acetobacter pomorum]|uniref:Flagellar biosynthesis protein FliO n=1 Tax=Acetobacter pomorum TaxID=65959 RepID=A0A2G4R8J9_9PROT|nr:hypothetical protein [Acetobacter pomorum]PHY92862.1 hypothetical protein CSR02_14645 [Acetobacter pomorum]